jgi:RNA polymerase sigma-70 factor (ECF subfamily)
METDEKLMLAAGAGDLAAFEQIVLRHQQTAWRIACRFLGDPTEAEDVAQDAFLRILKAAPSYRPSARFQTFLFQVVSRLCLDRMRKKRPVCVETLPDVAGDGESPSAALARAERDWQVRAALEALPPNQRLAIVLRYDGGLSYQEIAAAMRITPKAVERLLARARTALSVRLAQSEETGEAREGDFRSQPV